VGLALLANCLTTNRFACLPLLPNPQLLFGQPPDHTRFALRCPSSSRAMHPADIETFHRNISTTLLAPARSRDARTDRLTSPRISIEHPRRSSIGITNELFQVGDTQLLLSNRLTMVTAPADLASRQRRILASMTISFDKLTAHAAMIGADVPVSMTTTLGERTGSNFRTVVVLDQVPDRVLPAKWFGSEGWQQPARFPVSSALRARPCA
jgi:hypothetical protein